MNIGYMLAKLESQARESVAVQRENSPNTLGAYELVLEALSFYEGLGYHQEVDAIRRLVLEAQPTPELTLHFYALSLFHRRNYRCAIEAVNAALMIESQDASLHVLRGRILTALGDLPAAVTAYDCAQELAPNLGMAREGRFMIAAEQEMPGEDYYVWLQRFHERLQPTNYVEIGLGHGRSLAMAGPGTRAVGIDPFMGSWELLNYVSPHSPGQLFPLPSDDFFLRHDLREVIGTDTFDLAFIDGLHLFEQVLKDFINLERYAREDSVILIHDCLPVAPIVAERDRCTGFWTGDVWRIIPCLKTFRPDLKIFTIPTKPSGLAVVTGLDTTSTVLSNNYETIRKYFLGLNLPESTAQRFVLLKAEAIDEETALRRLSASN